ncbi:LPXTG cell wall anchor domain-containing protein, partial [bacterium c-19]|nr:LPXTG cell wall anchor domain-containing protein [bacterium c-19]
DPNQQGNDTDVKGAYYPGDSVGGALTGDETNLILYLGVTLIGIGFISYLLYRYKKDTFQ